MEALTSDNTHPCFVLAQSHYGGNTLASRQLRRIMKESLSYKADLDLDNLGPRCMGEEDYVPFSVMEERARVHIHKLSSSFASRLKG